MCLCFSKNLKNNKNVKSLDMNAVINMVVSVACMKCLLAPCKLIGLYLWSVPKRTINYSVIRKSGLGVG